MVERYAAKQLASLGSGAEELMIISVITHCS
jgi:hypothetical protein